MAGKTLKQARKEAGMTLNEVSQNLKIQVPTLSNYESGTMQPTLQDIMLLENFYGQNLEWSEYFDKEQLIEDLTVLIRNYPADAVIRSASKWLKEKRVGQKMISTFAEQTRKRNLSRGGRRMLGLDEDE